MMTLSLGLLVVGLFSVTAVAMFFLLSLVFKLKDWFDALGDVHSMDLP